MVMKTVIMKTMVLGVLSLVIGARTGRAASLTACTKGKLLDAMKACDSLVDISQLKCDDKKCHTALHVLVDPIYIECYKTLGLGSAEALGKYKELDDFCHGEGPDPADNTGAAPASSSGGDKNSTTPIDDALVVPPKATTLTPSSNGGKAVWALPAAVLTATAVGSLL